MPGRIDLCRMSDRFDESMFERTSTVTLVFAIAENVQKISLPSLYEDLFPAPPPILHLCGYSWTMTLVVLVAKVRSLSNS